MRQRITMKGEILVLAHTPNAAKQIESLLRSAGHGVHVLVAPGLDSFTDMIDKSDICIAIHDTEFADCDLIQVVEGVSRSKPGLPILLLSNNVDPRSITEAMSKGARDVISLANPTHLEMVLQQEFEYYSLKQKISLLQQKLSDLQDVRSQDLGTTAAPGLRVQEGIVVQANAALAQALNYHDPEDLMAVPFLDLVSDKDQTEIKRLVNQCMKHKRGEDSVKFTLKGDGGVRYELKCRLIPIEHDGEPALEIRGLESLTPSSSGGSGVARQALYQTIVERTEEASEDNLISLVFISIDEFEDIERRVGYAGAEELVAQAIRLLDNQESTASDQIFQFSPSEIALVGQRFPVDALNDILDHYRRAVARAIFKASGKEVHCTVSIAIQPLSSTPKDAEELLRNMREHSQKLEAAGGDRLEVIGSAAEDLERKRHREAWVQRIKEALADNRFELVYQNIASLSGEERQFSDILLRMLDDRGKQLMAREFLPTAESNGLMPMIDRWVIRHAAGVIEAQLKEYQDPCFFIRIGEDTLAQGREFVDWLQAFSDEHPDTKGHMVLVIRESHLQDHMASAQKLVAEAESLGIQVALDHFGKQRMSAQLLGRMQVHYVKLHADFTEVVTAGANDSALSELQAIMDQARINKIKTIAERVSDANSMARLWQLGVNYIMGSHVHEPEGEPSSTRFQLG